MRRVIGSFIAFLSGLFLLSGPLPAAEPQWLSASDAESADYFGTTVQTDGEVMIVGAPGAAYVFVLDNGIWRETTKLVTAESAVQYGYGSSVAIDGDVILVGAPLAVVDGVEEAGSVHVFKRKQGHAQWEHVARLVAGEPVPGGQFGKSVAIDNGRIIAGAPNAPLKEGHPVGFAYIFDHDPASSLWKRTTQLGVTDVVDDSQFGRSVAVSGNTVAVGRTNNSGKGSIYLYDYDGTNWRKTTVLQPGYRLHDGVGISVELEGDTLAIGAPEDAFPGDLRPWPGLVYIHERFIHGWKRVAVVEAAIPEALGGFGLFLDMNDGLIAVADAYDPGWQISVIAKGAGGGWTRAVALNDSRYRSLIGKGLGVSAQVLALGNPEYPTGSGTGALGVVFVHDMNALLAEQSDHSPDGPEDPGPVDDDDDVVETPDDDETESPVTVRGRRGGGAGFWLLVLLLPAVAGSRRRGD